MAHSKLRETFDLLKEFDEMDLRNIIMQASKHLCALHEPSEHYNSRIEDNPGFNTATDALFDGAVIAHVNVCKHETCQSHGMRETED